MPDEPLPSRPSIPDDLRRALAFALTFDGRKRLRHPEGIAALRKTSSSCHMASFTISARADEDGFEIEVVEHVGAPQTILGFGTLAEAEAWLVRCAYATGSLIRPAFVCCGATDGSSTRKRRRPKAPPSLGRKRPRKQTAQLVIALLRRTT